MYVRCLCFSGFLFPPHFSLPLFYINEMLLSIPFAEIKKKREEKEEGQAPGLTSSSVAGSASAVKLNKCLVPQIYLANSLVNIQSA